MWVRPWYEASFPTAAWFSKLKACISIIYPCIWNEGLFILIGKFQRLETLDLLQRLLGNSAHLPFTTWEFNKVMNMPLFISHIIICQLSKLSFIWTNSYPSPSMTKTYLIMALFGACAVKGTVAAICMALVLSSWGREFSRIWLSAYFIRRVAVINK
jgi:hypothetical protein